MGPGSAEPSGGGGRGEWRVTDEFRQRLGCGLGAAVALPAWFGVVALALGRDVTGLAVVVATALFAVSVVLGVSAVRRLRALPSVIALDADGWLRISGRHVSLALPVDALNEVEVGAAVGLESVRLHTHQGRTIRLPGDLGDLDGFLTALQQAGPALIVRDHRATGAEAPEDEDGKPGAGGASAAPAPAHEQDDDGGEGTVAEGGQSAPGRPADHREGAAGGDDRDEGNGDGRWGPV